MDMFVIQGRRQLSGTTRVSGAKNAALPMMAAALLSEGRTVLHEVPDLVDVRTLSALLQELGAEVHFENGTLEIEVLDESNNHADYELVRRMRASICVLGPLLAKRKQACVSLPGGCNIGHRPIDLHLKGLRALGAEIEVRNGYVYASAEELTGTNIYLGGTHGSTVTGTCNVMSAATVAHGTTTIEAAAREPEVVALGEFLNSMGARITGLGTSVITIQGVAELHSTHFHNIPDRIEAATLLMAAVATHSSITLTNTRSEHLAAVLDVLQSLGATITAQATSITISSPEKSNPLHVTALPYPGIPTDVQAQLMVLMCLAHGTSVIKDQVFPDRFMHVSELVRMGANIQQQGASAFIQGIQELSAASVMASDLRASAALVIAGLAAQGETTLRRIYHLDRGYEHLEKKLCQLGADVKRVRDDGRIRQLHERRRSA